MASTDGPLEAILSAADAAVAAVDGAGPGADDTTQASLRRLRTIMRSVVSQVSTVDPSELRPENQDALVRRFQRVVDVASSSPPASDALDASGLDLLDTLSSILDESTSTTSGAGLARAPRLEHQDIRSGLTLMNSVYAIAIVLGFRGVIAAAYELIVHRHSPQQGTLPLYVVIPPLVTITLLLIRFSWVPRNLGSYIVNRYQRDGDRVFTITTLVNFPIALLHALMFFFVCDAFVDLAAANTKLTTGTTEGIILRFVVFYAALLLLNALWLLFVIRIKRPVGTRRNAPPAVWGYNNLIAFALVGLWVGLAEWQRWSYGVLMVGACGLFLLNSIVDLARAAKSYILYEDPVVE